MKYIRAAFMKYYNLFHEIMSGVLRRNDGEKNEGMTFFEMSYSHLAQMATSILVFIVNLHQISENYC